MSVYEKDGELVSEDNYVKHYKEMMDELINKMDEDGSKCSLPWWC